MISEKVLKKAVAHNEICNELRAKGYTIQGCDKTFKKCYFASGEYPNQKIVGYIDEDTLKVVFEQVS